ncbi:MAG: tRNA pseudouridine(55) synthase TruB, partial [Tenericutes bacterium GWC2_39_45]
MDGFLLINKPKGWTSHDVVHKVQKKLNVEKIGHTGTLDPFASGLLILCLGKATKLASLFSNLDKVYEGTIVFDKHYDTYDTTGKITNEKETIIDIQSLQEAILSLNGTYEQIPPMYSAIKVDGRKLYEMARKGIEIERESRSVTIYDFHMTRMIDHNRFDFYASVSKGTYIRSLAVDLAQKLETYGALDALRRISVGKYDVANSKSIEDVSEGDLISLDSYFESYPTLSLNDYMVRLVRNGVYLDERQTK